MDVLMFNNAFWNWYDLCISFECVMGCIQQIENKEKQIKSFFFCVCVFFFNVLYTAWPIWTDKYSIKFFFSLDNGLILFKDLLESGVNEQKKRGGAWILQYKWRNNAVF